MFGIEVRSYYALFFLSIGSLLIISSSAYALDDQRSITLTATGIVTATPDQAHISTAVETFHETAKVAVQQNSAQMTKIIAALKDEGVEKEHIQTTSFNVQPQYESYSATKPKRNPQIIGYRVTNSISITLIDIKKLGDVLDKAVSLGANRISGIRFTVSNADELSDKARDKAMQQAIKRAKLYVKSAGTRLGRVHTIRESSQYVSTGPVTRIRTLSKSDSVPVEAGSAKISVQITVTWKLWR